MRCGMNDTYPPAPFLQGKGSEMGFFVCRFMGKLKAFLVMQRSKRNIVIGQRVDPIKARRSQVLREQMTEEEATLWQYLRANRLGGAHFRRQQVIDGFIVDFYCHAAGLVIEVDGNGHDEQVVYDAERDRILQARGLQVLRISNAEVRDHLNGVLQMISSHLNSKK
jgi:very-short-patch-repair endonuclease